MSISGKAPAILLLLLFCVCGQDDFQKRLIYLSEQDNACRLRSDSIKVSVILDRIDWFDIPANGGTGCSDGVKYASMIRPTSSWWAYIEKDYKNNQVHFQDETTTYTSGGVLLGIVQKTRVTNATFNGLPYKCRVYGDGKIQHFGTNIPDQRPATVTIGCDRITTDVETQQVA